MTPTDLLAAASKVLEKGNYSRIKDAQIDKWSISNSRLYEDPYSIVAVIVYETWEDLLSNWMGAQTELVELISEYITSADAKAWEGYLVLMTPNLLPRDAQIKASEIRYNTSRVRKLLGTGEELSTITDVEQVLLPLLPLEIERGIVVRETILEILPGLLSGPNLAEEAIRVIIEAFREDQPIIERLHEYRSRI